ncbi:MAG: hypothetical protein K5905_00170 [Roseibium sp.]|uniref:hypothetical protein n=1 Tax=Roseibium sp. TaxID=1936156 RepID=UPI002620724A|nr:hypothetical protein [Roseibium sp.]MCV0423864.1 hypothetical protein [Roseibium sp.]
MAELLGAFTSSTSGLLALGAMFFGVVALLLGGFAAAIRDKESADAESAYQAKLDQKTDKITVLQDEISSLQSETIKMITGGDSFPVVNLVQHPKLGMGKFSPEIWVSGAYHLRNVKVSITIVSGAETNKYSFEEVSLRAYGGLPFDLIVNAAAEGGATLSVRTSAENGTWYQKIDFRKADDGRFQFKTKIVRFGHPQTTVLKKDFDEDLSFGSIDEMKRSPTFVQ